MVLQSLSRSRSKTNRNPSALSAPMGRDGSADAAFLRRRQRAGRHGHKRDSPAANNWSSPSTAHWSRDRPKILPIIRSRKPLANPELVTRSGASVKIVAASYSDT